MVIEITTTDKVTTVTCDDRVVATIEENYASFTSTVGITKSEWYGIRSLPLALNNIVTDLIKMECKHGNI